MMLKNLLILPVLLAFTSGGLQAQNKTQKPYKPPKLTSALGILSGNKKATVAEIRPALSVPLSIKDSAGTRYKISSYQFMYRQRAMTEDENTGEMKPATSLYSNLFKETPLPALWVNNVSEGLKPGDEISFFDIIVKDAKGRIMYAPDIVITVK